MNTTEQILIRMGVDAKAVVTGLNKTSSLIKGWAAGMKHEMTHGVGKLLTAAFVFDKALEGLDKVKDRILEIKRFTERTGVDSNFAQSLMLRAIQSGESLSEVEKPLSHLNELIGQAKLGSPAAIASLNELGIATGKAQIKTLTYTQAIHNLSVEFGKMHDKQKQAALLQEAFGKGAYKLNPIFEGGTAEIDKMSSGNFFTKMSKNTINDFSDMWAGIKTVGFVTMATLSNAFDGLTKPWRKMWIAIGAGTLSTAKVNAIEKQMQGQEEKSTFEKGLQNEADQEGITIQEEKAKILNQQNELMQRQSELTSEILDRNKSSISEMAAHARKMLGIPEPRNYTVSVRDREALRIDTMEKQAKIAYEHGDDRKGQALTSEALQARAAFKGGTLKDRDPMGKTEVELAKVNLQLEPVKRMADLINETHKAPK